MITAEFCRNLQNQTKDDDIFETYFLIIKRILNKGDDIDLYLTKNEVDDLQKRGFKLEALETITKDNTEHYYRISW